MNLFRFFIVGVSLVVIVITGLITMRLQDKEGATGIVFDPSQVCLNTLRQGESTLIELRLRNLTPDEITVNDVATTCHCTQVSSLKSGDVIEPFGEVLLSVSFETGLADGPVQSLVYVEAQGHGQILSARFEVSGDVVPEYRVVPDYLDFGMVNDKMGAVLKVQVVPECDPDVAVVKVESSGVDFVASLLQEPQKPARTVQVEFVPPRPMVAGVRTGSLVLHTTSERARKIVIPVRAILCPVVELKPPSVVLSSNNVEQRVIVEASSQRQIKIVSCQSSSKTIECIWDKALVSAKHELLFRLSQDHDLRPQSHEVRITVVASQGVALLEEFTLNLPVSVLADTINKE